MDFKKELSNLITVAASTAAGWLIAQGYDAALVGAVIAFAVAFLNNRIELWRQRQMPPDLTKPIVPTPASEPLSKSTPLILIGAVLLSIVIGAGGCTAPQVTGVINGTNQVIDQALTPIADTQDVQGVGPYIRLGATFVRDVLYKFTDLVRVFAPNAGEGQ